MRLNNLDKYIKDKLQGYKPSYQEDMWKAIEEKLPTSKVPNGNGSWMIVAFAALIIVALVPFLLKFNTVADMREETAQTKQDKQVVQNRNETSTAKQTNPSGAIHNSLDQADNNPNSDPANQVASLEPSIISGQGNKYSKIKTGISNNHTGAFKIKEHRSKNTFKHTDKEAFNESINSISDKNEQNENLAMFHINLSPSEIDNEHDQDFKNAHTDDDLGRYADRSSNLKNAKWANWQSIFYPFWQNPAYAGSEGKVNVNFGAKIDMIENINSGNIANTNTDIAIDFRLPILGGMGIGAFRTTEPSTYSQQTIYGLALSKSIINKGSTSVKIGASLTSINNSYFYNSINFADQLVPGIGFVNATNEKNLASTTQAFGINGGIWVSNPHLMAGIDVVNINKPHLEHIAEAARLPRLYRATIGYRFATSRDLQWMPMLIATNQNGINQANATLTAVFKNKIMATVAYQNIDPTSGLGNVSFYAGWDASKNFRLFASYGMNAEYQAALGVSEHFARFGIKYQIL